MNRRHHKEGQRPSESGVESAAPETRELNANERQEIYNWVKNAMDTGGLWYRMVLTPEEQSSMTNFSDPNGKEISFADGVSLYQAYLRHNPKYNGDLRTFLRDNGTQYIDESRYLKRSGGTSANPVVALSEIQLGAPNLKREDYDLLRNVATLGPLVASTYRDIFRQKPDVLAVTDFDTFKEISSCVINEKIREGENVAHWSKIEKARAKAAEQNTKFTGPSY